MDASRPDVISFWSLDLRVRDPRANGRDIPVDDDNVNELIRLVHNRWEWQAPRLYDLALRRTGAPVLPTLQPLDDPRPVKLSLVGDKDIVIRGDRIIFRNSGLAGTVDQDTSARILTEPVDGTENVSLTATVAGITHSEQKANALMAGDSTVLPVAANQPFEETRARKQLSDFLSVQPIFYLEQDVGFVLLAEVFQAADERRLLYTLRAVSEAGGVETPKRRPSIDDAQIKAITPAFGLADGNALHTIRAHQDGNLGATLGGHRGYLEFWVNGLPLGIRQLSDARFRFRGGPAQLYIGAWPRGDGMLFLTGEIAHINFDPINKCTPC